MCNHPHDMRITVVFEPEPFLIPSVDMAPTGTQSILWCSQCGALGFKPKKVSIKEQDWQKVTIGWAIPKDKRTEEHNDS